MSIKSLFVLDILLNGNVGVVKAVMMVLKNCLPSNFTLESFEREIKRRNLSKRMPITVTIPVSSANGEHSISTVRRQ